MGASARRKLMNAHDRADWTIIPHDHSHAYFPPPENAARDILPARYQAKAEVSAAAMGATDLKYNSDGQVAWDEIWQDFCDLALAGGPPHRGTLLEPVSQEAAIAQPENYQNVLRELERGIMLVSVVSTHQCNTPGWIGMECHDEAMAVWLLRAIVVENVSVRREGAVLYFPAGPDFTVEAEIKNIITVIAKTNHYWQEHAQVMNAQ